MIVGNDVKTRYGSDNVDEFRYRKLEMAVASEPPKNGPDVCIKDILDVLRFVSRKIEAE